MREDTFEKEYSTSAQPNLNNNLVQGFKSLFSALQGTPNKETSLYFLFSPVLVPSYGSNPYTELCCFTTHQS